MTEGKEQTHAGDKGYSSGFAVIDHPRSAGTPVFYDGTPDEDEREEHYRSLLANGWSDYEARAIAYEEEA